MLLAKFAPAAHATRGDVGFELGFALYEQSSALPPVIVMRTDGGGDHNASFTQVQLSLISLFCACNLEKLVAVRTAPGCSFVNDYKKGMAVLNVGLENVSLERSKICEIPESLAKKLSCMVELREQSAKHSDFKEAWMESTKSPARIIEERCSRLKVRNPPVDIHKLASEHDICALHGVIKTLFDEDYHSGLTWKVHLAKLSLLSQFMKVHCRISTYMFVISRCQDSSHDFYGDDSSRCGPLAQSLSKHNPPLPRLDISNPGHYMKYDEIKEQPSDESYLPSLDVLKQDKAEIEETKQTNKQTKAKHGDGIFRQGKIVHYVRCQECMAARLIYSTSSKLEIETEMPSLIRFIETNDYICGCSFL